MKFANYQTRWICEQSRNPGSGPEGKYRLQADGNDSDGDNAGHEAEGQGHGEGSQQNHGENDRGPEFEAGHTGGSEKLAGEIRAGLRHRRQAQHGNDWCMRFPFHAEEERHIDEDGQGLQRDEA